MDERRGKREEGRPAKARRTRERSHGASFAPEALGAILERAGESRFARTRPPLPLSLWRRDAVGARIADRAQPISMLGGVLRSCASLRGVWAHELSLLAEDVCTRLRERGVDARELRFRVRSRLPPWIAPPERRLARAVPAARQLPRDLARALGAVSDDELRGCIERAAAANLAWQEMAAPAPEGDVSEARRAARAPRSAEEGSAPQGRESSASRGASRRTPAGGRDRSR